MDDDLDKDLLEDEEITPKIPLDSEEDAIDGDEDDKDESDVEEDEEAV
ncbi:MAG: hypothetical protein V1896_02865 [Candidatus Zambryskibacteria bacterium]